MYRNIVSSRELLSDGFSQDRGDLSQDTQQYSQLAYSQPEFSQVSTQDMFTQQFSNGSSSQTISNIPIRKPTLYDKWKSKTATPFRSMTIDKSAGSINKMASCSNHSQSRPDIIGHHQLEINKVKAKERDERDFLQQVVNTVQDCTKEVRLTLKSVKEKIEHNDDMSQQNLQQMITSFLDDLCKHQERVLSAVEEKDTCATKYHELEKELAVKAAKIKALEKTVEEYKRDTPEKIISALQKQMRSPQRKMDDKLAELLETMRENHEQYVHQIQEQKQQLEQQQCLFLEHKKAQQTQVKDFEKRLLNDLSNLRKDIKKKENTCLQDILDQLKLAQEQQLEELERHFTTLLEGSNQTAANCTRDQRPQKKEVQELLKKHWDGVEKILESRFKQHLKLQEEQLIITIEKVTGKENKDEQTDSFLSLPQFEDKMGRYHEDFKKQVESLHERHLQELKQLKSEMVSKQDKQPDTFSSQAQPSNQIAKGEMFTWDEPKKRPGQNFHFPEKKGFCEATWRRDSAIVSPLTANYKKVNTRSFFSKTASSPIATVLPVRKESKVVEVASNEPGSEQPPDLNPVNPIPLVIKKKSKKKRKKSRFSKPKKNKASSAQCENTNSQNINSESVHLSVKEEKSAPTLTIIPTRKLPPVTATQTQTLIPSKSFIKSGTGRTNSKAILNRSKMSVYDFNDEELKQKVATKNIPFFGSSMQRYSYNSKKEVMTVNTSQTVTFPRPPESPYQDSVSRDSSPSLSITEVVVKRRIKCDKRTPNLDFSRMNADGFQKIGTDTQFPQYDILSTPTVNAVSSRENSFWSYKQNVHQQPQTVRRGGEKRKLCDMSLNDSVMQCIQKQTKRICR